MRGMTWCVAHRLVSALGAQRPSLHTARRGRPFRPAAAHPAVKLTCPKTHSTRPQDAGCWSRHAAPHACQVGTSARGACPGARLWAGCSVTNGMGSPVPVRRLGSTGGHARHEQCLQARFELPLEESGLPRGVNAAGAGSQLPSWLQRIGEVGDHLHQRLQLRCQRGHIPQVDVPAGQAGTWSKNTTRVMMLTLIHMLL